MARGRRGGQMARRGSRRKPTKFRNVPSKKRKNVSNGKGGDGDRPTKYMKMFDEPRTELEGENEEYEESEEEEDQVLDPVMELMSTFDGDRQQSQNVNDSSDDDEEEEEQIDQNEEDIDEESEDNATEEENEDDITGEVHDEDDTNEDDVTNEESNVDDINEDDVTGEEAEDDVSNEEADDDDINEEAENDASDEESDDDGNVEAENDVTGEEAEDESEDDVTGEEAEDESEDDVTGEEAEDESEDYVTEEAEHEPEDDVTEEEPEVDVTAEEEEDDVTEDEPEDDEEESSDCHDPFVQHFNFTLPESVVEQLAKKESWDTIEESWPKLGQISKTFLRTDLQSVQQRNDYSIKPGKGLQDLGLRKQLHIGWNKVNPNAEADNPFTDLQRELFSVMHSYSDLLFCRRTHDNGEELRATYCLHILNHVLNTRNHIAVHSSKLSQNEDVPEEYRDQGLARPKILIIVPFRESALRIVRKLIDILLLDASSNVMNKKRFNDEYGQPESERPNRKLSTPPDHDATFSGNTDDNFRFGVATTKKSIRIFSNFYSSDIIIASPLGLRTIVGAKGEKGRDFDFLSSIEILIIDQAEVLLMQNWEHLMHVLEHLHLRPLESHGVDFSRVRLWTLEGWSKHYRQTLCFSGVACPEVHSIFSRLCCNRAGVVKTKGPLGRGSIRQVVVQLPQVFQRFQASSPNEDADARFEYFVTKVFPQFKEAVMTRTMIFVPSYFDYVRLRNHFRKEDVSFVQICEYTTKPKVAQARDRFFHAERRYLLYTERTHFYRRYAIKGIRHLVFYQLPLLPHLYSELCNMTQLQGKRESQSVDSYITCTVMFSKYDAHRLAAVVGTDRASHMLSSEKDVFMFVTGET